MAVAGYANDFFKDDDSVKAWNFTQKNHHMLHSAKLAEHINPRLVWCFRGEDMMQKMQTLAKSCVRRLNGAAASIKIANRYRLALHLEYTKNEKATWTSVRCYFC